jgi:hypothetical protein
MKGTIDLRTVEDLYCAAVLATGITLDSSRFEQWTALVMGYGTSQLY